MASIATPGLASGLDVNSIVSQLMTIERQPLFRLAEKEVGLNTEVSAVGSLKSAVSGLQDSIDALKDSTTFTDTKTSTSDSAVVSASTENDTALGTFNVTVDRLAQRHKTASNEFASTTTFGGTSGDTLTLTVDTTSFDIDLSTAQTLSQIRDSINGTSNTTGISASVINGDNGNETLVLTSQETGFSERVQTSFSGTIDANTFSFDTINQDKDGVTITTDSELDASIVVDGVSITRASNSISDVVTGVTLNINSVGSSTVGIVRDTGKITAAIATFVGAYNTLENTMTDLSADALQGDSIIRNLESQLRRVISTSVSDLGDFSYLQEVGITTNKDGTLALNTTDLNFAINQDLDGLNNLFTDSANGFATRLDSAISPISQTGGSLDLRVEGLDRQIRDIGTQRERLNVRLASKEEGLLAQFNSLETLISSLNTTSSFLTTQLESIAKIPQQGN